MNKAGWFVAVFLAGVLFTFAWQIGNPVAEVHDHVAVPVAQSLGVVSESPCKVERNGDAITRHCTRGPWTVYLTADGDFDWAWYFDGDESTSKSTRNPNDVPGWPW